MLSEVKFVDYDAQQIEAELIDGYEAATGETLYPGDERRIFLQNLIPVIMGLKASINDTGRQNLLPFARGSILDAIGTFTATARLQPQKASTTLRFTLSEAQLQPVTIPADTRATPDGKLYFATLAAVTIPAGQFTGEGKALATEAGEAHNGFTAGQIKLQVDPVPFVTSVINTVTSGGGTDTESDDAYRARIQLAPEAFSTAGPEAAYEYWAKTADENIADVSVTSPSAGVIQVIVLMAGGAIPSQAVLDKVLAAVSPRNRRPLGDNVQVAAPVEVTYNIDATYYISVERETEVTQIRAAIENTGGEVDQYEAWQKAVLGRRINPDELRRRMLDAGAYKIVLTSPAYIDLLPNQVAKRNLKTLTYGGVI